MHKCHPAHEQGTTGWTNSEPAIFIDPPETCKVDRFRAD
jgi:hypothetical protein